MKSAWVVVVLVSVLLAGSAWAQFPFDWSVGSLTKGLTPDFSGSTRWLANPAALAVPGMEPQEGNEWAHDVSASYTSLGGPKTSPWESVDLVFGSWSSYNPEKGVGVGAGFADLQFAGRAIGGGVGVRIGHTGLSVGANLLHFAPDPIPWEQTVLDVGAMYAFNQGDDRGPLLLGVSAFDATGELPAFTPIYNAQGWWPVTNRLRLGGEVRDITGEIPGLNTPWSAGGEYDFSTDWTLRLGVLDWGVSGLDIQFAGGLCYNFGRYRVEGGVASPVDGTAIPPGVDMNWTWTVGGGVSF